MAREADMRPAVEDWLRSRGCLVVPGEVFVANGWCDVVGVRFAARVGRKIPAAELIIAVELKLADVAGVLRQAAANAMVVDESFAAMPGTRIARMHPATLQRFHLAGIGLLGVHDGRACRVLGCNRRQTLTRRLWRRTAQQRAGRDKEKGNG